MFAFFDQNFCHSKSEKYCFSYNFLIFFVYMCRFEMTDWQGQAELLKQQTLATLSDRDQQVRQLNAMLEEARASKLRHEHTQRQV